MFPPRMPSKLSRRLGGSDVASLHALAHQPVSRLDATRRELQRRLQDDTPPAHRLRLSPDSLLSVSDPYSKNNKKEASGVVFNRLLPHCSAADDQQRDNVRRSSSCWRDARLAGSMSRSRATLARDSSLSLSRTPLTSDCSLRAACLSIPPEIDSSLSFLCCTKHSVRDWWTSHGRHRSSSGTGRRLLPTDGKRVP